MERLIIVGDNPVREKVVKRVTKSRSGHEKSWLNIGGPSSKAKYYLLTDSERVPWGKGEKNPGEGSEIDPETVCVQAVEAEFSSVTAYLLYNGSASYLW
jgi:hypothetical protein